MARRLGATDAMLHGVRSDGAAGLELYAALAEHWDQGEIVEITTVVGLFAYFNRFNDALRVEVTK